MPMYLNDVPKSGQTLAVTRAPINQNFQTIDAAFQVDHVGYTLANQGFHNKVTMPLQSVAPAGLANTSILYSANSVLTGANELFLNKNNGTAFPLTGGLKNDTGWCYLPNGLVEKWGTFNAASTPNPTTVDASQGPQISDRVSSTSGILNIQISILNTGAAYNPVNPVYVTGQFVGPGNGNKFGLRNAASVVVPGFYRIIGVPV